MMKAAILLASAVIYLWTIHLGQVAAERGIAQLKNLYTSATTQSDIVLSSNSQCIADTTCLLNSAQ